MKTAFVIAVLAGMLLFGPVSVNGQNNADVLKLIEALKDSRHAVVLGAIEKLGNQGSAAKAAVPTLVVFLRKNHKEFPVQAARALAKIGAPAVPELIKVLDDPSDLIKFRALLTLGTIGREARLAVLPVAKLLESDDARIRLVAALVLGAMHEEARPAASQLAKTLRDPDGQVRFVAADSLYQVGPEGIDFVLPVVRDKNPAIRVNALAAVARFLESEKSVAALVEALQDTDVKIRAMAIGGLVRLGPAAKSSLPQLLENLQNEDQDVQKNALTAIMAIGLRGNTELRDKLTALNEIGNWQSAHHPLRDANAVKSLLVLSSAANPTARLTAALALGNLGPGAKDALPILKRLMKDRDYSVRAAAYLAESAIDRVEVNWAAVDDCLKEAILDQKGSKDAAELVRLHIVFSVMPCLAKGAREPAPALRKSLNENKAWTRKTLDEFGFGFEHLPSLLEGMNLSAQWNLGFTEPFSRLAYITQRVVQETKDVNLPVVVFQNLGNGVTPSSLYWPAIQQQWTQILSKVPVDLLIMEKQERIRSAQALLTRYDKFFKNTAVVPVISSYLTDFG